MSHDDSHVFSCSVYLDPTMCFWLGCKLKLLDISKVDINKVLNDV